MKKFNYAQTLQKPYARKISSHSGWYRGRWEVDTCSCGNKMQVPVGKKGYYRCNNCADCAEGLCEY